MEKDTNLELMRGMAASIQLSDEDESIFIELAENMQLGEADKLFLKSYIKMSQKQRKALDNLIGDIKAGIVNLDDIDDPVAYGMKLAHEAEKETD